jgi:two-component system response regulator HydG
MSEVVVDPKASLSLVGGSGAIEHIVQLIDQVATSECAVLIEGESGTGKEVIARRLHARSARGARPFVPVNCAGVGEGVFESQFFGHVRGAFTGAEQTMLGLVRAADGGTLFLDEVGEIPISVQAKLLRVLQDGEVLAVGTTQPVQVSTRFVAATNRDLRAEVESGRFRKDLYYRLNIVRIQIPPLRDRPEDVEPLLRHFLSHFAKRYGRPAISVTSHAVRTLEGHSWPGNVRELAGWVERLYVTTSDPHLAAIELTAGTPGTLSSGACQPAASRALHLQEIERWAIRQAMERSSRNIAGAAAMLGIHRTTLWRKLRQHNIIS